MSPKKSNKPVRGRKWRPPAFVQSTPLKVKRFAGVGLGGGKTDKTCIAILEYYPEQKKIFLRRLYDRIKFSGEKSSDQIVCEILSTLEGKIETVAFDAPLTIPKCLRCRLKCPGYEKCKEPEIKYMWKVFRKRAKSKRPNKIFTPYTERCAEMYIANELEESFSPSHALGANAAPLTARALFLRRRLKAPTIEVYPKLSIWRVGRALGVAKSHLRHHKHSVDGNESREVILNNLVDSGVAFIYHQDFRLMVDDNNAFEAFVCALTAFLKHRGQVEKRPGDIPKSDGWVEIPVKNINWV